MTLTNNATAEDHNNSSVESSSSITHLTPRAMADAALAKAMHELAATTAGTDTTTKTCSGTPKKEKTNKQKRKKKNKKNKKNKKDGTVRVVSLDDSMSSSTSSTSMSSSCSSSNTGAEDVMDTKVTNSNERKNGKTTTVGHFKDNCDERTNNDDFANDADALMMKHDLDEAWGCITNPNNYKNDCPKNYHSNNNELDLAYEKTTKLIHKQMENFVRKGMKAFHKTETTARELQLLKEQLKGKDMEIQRLRKSEEVNRKTISNLYQSLEITKTDQMKISGKVVNETKLRQQVNEITMERDDFQNQMEKLKAKNQLLQDELQQTKLKLHHSTQEKIKMEHDQRATLSLAQKLDNHVSIDCDFYKRKVVELNAHIQGKNATIAEKDRQIHELRNQMERSLSQNRLAANLNHNTATHSCNGNNNVTSWNSYYHHPNANTSSTRKRPAL